MVSSVNGVMLAQSRPYVVDVGFIKSVINAFSAGTAFIGLRIKTIPALI